MLKAPILWYCTNLFLLSRTWITSHPLGSLHDPITLDGPEDSDGSGKVPSMHTEVDERRQSIGGVLLSFRKPAGLSFDEGRTSWAAKAN